MSRYSAFDPMQTPFNNNRLQIGSAARYRRPNPQVLRQLLLNHTYNPLLSLLGDLIC